MSKYFSEILEYEILFRFIRYFGEEDRKQLSLLDPDNTSDHYVLHEPHQDNSYFSFFPYSQGDISLFYIQDNLIYPFIQDNDMLILPGGANDRIGTPHMVLATREEIATGKNKETIVIQTRPKK
jgi:hypothetical protein